jgi:Phage tail protein
MWNVISYNGFSLSDASYSAYLEDSNNSLVMPTIKSSVITRGQYPPTLVGLQREMDKLTVTVKIKAVDWRTALKNLAAACINDEAELASLIVVDNTGTQWSVQARAINILRTKYDKTYDVPMDVPDLSWKKAAATTTWNITTSGDTQAVNNSGNRKVRPIIKIKPTALKADGFLYRHWVSIKNPNTDRAFPYWALDLTDGGVDTRPWVRDPSNYVQINNGAGITNSQTTIPYDTLTGVVPTFGMGYIDDGSNQEQISWTGRTGTTSGNLTGVTRHIGGTSAYAFADNVKIYLSYMQANGADVRFYRNGLLQNLWPNGPNAAATKLWFVARESQGLTLTLKTALLATGDVLELELQTSMANYNTLVLLPTEGVLVIDNEAFHFCDRDPIRFTVDINARAINDTTAAAHAIAASVTWIEHDDWLYSGNPLLTAQETDDRRKPILDMATSTNVVRDYTSFWEKNQLRAGAWTPDVESSSFGPNEHASRYYTGNHTDEDADPATEMGMWMQSIYKSGLWRYENGNIHWRIYEPAGIYRVVSWVTEKYRTGASWPLKAALEKSKEGILWTDVVALASPTAAASWGSPATVGPYVAGSGYYFLQTSFRGVQGCGQAGGVGLQSAMETNALQYETVNPLDVSIGARSDNTYEVNCIIKNMTNNLYFKIRMALTLNDEVEIDCEAKTVTIVSNNKRYRSGLFVPGTQADWMVLDPGNNTFKYTEDGLVAVTVTIEHSDLLAV